MHDQRQLIVNFITMKIWFPHQKRLNQPNTPPPDFIRKLKQSMVFKNRRLCRHLPGKAVALRETVCKRIPQVPPRPFPSPGRVLSADEYIR